MAPLVTWQLVNRRNAVSRVASCPNAPLTTAHNSLMNWQSIRPYIMRGGVRYPLSPSLSGYNLGDREYGTDSTTMASALPIPPRPLASSTRLPSSSLGLNAIHSPMKLFADLTFVHGLSGSWRHDLGLFPTMLQHDRITQILLRNHRSD